MEVLAGWMRINCLFSEEGVTNFKSLLREAKVDIRSYIFQELASAEIKGEASKNAAPAQSQKKKKGRKRGHMFVSPFSSLFHPFSS